MKTTTSEAAFGKVLEEDPPRVVFHLVATRPDGKRRAISFAPAVLDPALLERIRATHRGEMVRVTVATDWDSDELSSTLMGFVPLGRPAPFTV